MKIGAREVGNGAPCLVVAEVGMAHDGSLGMAHAYIDAVAKAGAGAVKFQHHCGHEPGEWRLRPEWCDLSRQDYWTHTGFDVGQWAGLRDHAERSGLQFLCSTFSAEGADDMEPLVPAWKVASGQVTNGPMLDYMAAHPRPAIISTGMSTESELHGAVGRLRARTSAKEWGEGDVLVLKSTSLYPTPLDQVGIERQTFQWLGYSGLSDHSGTIWPALAAATMGAALVEVHVTFSREAYGPDAASSITIEELQTLCEGIEAIRKAQQPVDREALLAGSLKEARRVYMGVGA